MGIFFALLAALFFSCSYTALKRSYKELAPSIAFMLNAVFGVVIWVPVATLYGGVNPSNFLDILPWAVISAILSEAYFFYVLSKGEISITGTLLASYPVYTIVFSGFINKEFLTPAVAIAIAATIIGTLVISTNSIREKIEEPDKKRYIFWALSGAIAVGLSDSLSKFAIDAVSFQDFLFILAIVQVPIAIGYLKVEKQKISRVARLISELSDYKFALIGSLLNASGVLFLWLSFSATYASIASPLTAAYPAIVVILAHLLLKEKIQKKTMQE